MIEQRTEEWFRARAGRLTASNFKRVMEAKTDRALKTLAREIVADAERIAAGDFSNALDDVPAIRWGREYEPAARAAYTMETGNDVADAGFYVWPEHPLIGASPDGLVGEDGLVEFKCPFSRAQHHDYGNGPGSARWQVWGQLIVTGRAWCDFASYDPRERPELQLYVHRITVPEAEGKWMRAAMLDFVWRILWPLLDFAGVVPDDAARHVQNTRSCYSTGWM